MKNLTDEQLVEEIKKNKQLFSILIDRYQKKIEKYVFYLTNRKEEVDDLVQEIFIKVFVNLNSFDIKKKFASWLFRIAHNQVVNFFKKYKNKLSLDEKIMIVDESNIEENIEKDEVKKILNSCLEKIPIGYKEIILLYYFEELSYEEISDSLKIPIGTVSIRLSRAKKFLKKLCQEKI
ncbi:MAG: RNA polymerase sigma factor [Patescibacteria group bacterium]|nr:MAG: RNA polymerase sigma factor [Patescibacteria group bacterium]